MFKIILFVTAIFITFFSFSQDPTSKFTASTYTACVGEEITFTSTSIVGGAPIVSWTWNFDYGYSGTGATTKFSFPVAHTYNILLIITDQNGKTDKNPQSVAITINPNPNAQFLINANNCTLPVNASYTNQSDVGSNFTYNWKLANNTTSTLFTPPSETYATAGNYTIDLTVTNSTTKCASTVSKTIAASNFAAKFNMPDSICISTIANFTDQSSAGANNWLWKIGNLNSLVIQNPSQFFNLAGTYPIKLVAKNTVSGCKDSITKNLVVVPLPKPSFTAAVRSGCVDLNVTFTNTTVGGSNFIWDFGDGSPLYNEATLHENPVHKYTTNGFFTVKLTGTGKNGCSHDTIRFNYVHTAPPVALFGASTKSGCTALNVTLFDLSNSINPASDPISSWDWDFGDGTTSTVQFPSHTFTTGKYPVKLKIKTLSGCEATSLIDTIRVGEIDLVDFSNAPKIICGHSESVAFTNLTVISKPYLPYEVTYDWKFGDPNGQGTSALKDPTYSYPADTGYMKVTLKVNFRGCEQTKIIDSAVFVKPAIAQFMASKVCNPANFPVNIPATDNAILGRQGDDIKMIWKWGDPLNSSATITSNSYDHSSFSGNSSFNYPDYGTYRIWQVVQNFTTGCLDSIFKDITISKVIPDFTLSAAAICKNGTVTMTGNSTSMPASGFPIVSYIYDMGDGNNTLGNGIPNVSYKYTSSSTFPVTMTATNNVQCSATKTLPLIVYELPAANIKYPVDTCGPALVIFKNTSKAVGNGFPTFSSFKWIMPRGTGTQTTNSINATTQFNFTNSGNYRDSIKLIATDGFGCISDTITKFINVSKPTAQFSITPIICNKTSISPVNLSSGNNTYKWYIDNIVSPSSNFLFTENSNAPNNKVDHTIKLVATDIHGCKDSINNPLTISLPKADFKPSFTGAATNSDKVFSCPPVFATMTNNSKYIGSTPSYNWVFGDGKVSALVAPQNVYIYANTYTASLNMIDQYGCKDDTILVDYLTIGGPSTKIKFDSIGTICDNLFHFDTLNSKSIDHLIWNFGDGSSSSVTPIEHDYPLAGTYTPTLTIYDINNCTVDYPMTAFSVPNETHAHYTITPNEGKTGEAVVFDDQSIFTAPIISWYWKFGDFDSTTQSNSSDANVNFTYNFPYIYQTSLTVIDTNGCVSTLKIPINVKGDFSVANVFTPNGDGINDVFTFFHDLFKTFDITIVNRWDNVVYEKTNSTGIIIWDGQNMNKEQCAEGVYFYIIKGTLMDGTPIDKVGFITKI